MLSTPRRQREGAKREIVFAVLAWSFIDTRLDFEGRKQRTLANGAEPKLHPTLSAPNIGAMYARP